MDYAGEKICYLIYEMKDKYYDAFSGIMRPYEEADFYTSGSPHKGEILEFQNGELLLIFIKAYYFNHTETAVENGDHCFDYYMTYKYEETEMISEISLWDDANECRSRCRLDKDCKLKL